MSPCYRMTDDGGKTTGFICMSGDYKHLIRAQCPWCCLGSAHTVHAVRLVHGGWCAPDMVCGRCGQYWTHDDDGRLRRTRPDEVRENLRMVREMKRGGLKVGPMPLPPDLVAAAKQEPKA